MALVIRKAVPGDAERWLQLLHQALGADASPEQFSEFASDGQQLTGSRAEETWVAEVDGELHASVSILGTEQPNNNPIANLGRYLALPQSYQDGSAEALISGVNDVCVSRRHIAVTRVAASDNAQQKLLEKLGYVCVGFQPLKHLFVVRHNVLFYVRIPAPGAITRYGVSQSLPQIVELGSVVLQNLQLSNPECSRDGLTGYPLQAELTIEEAAVPEYEAARAEAQAASPALEICGEFNRGLGILRVAADTDFHVLLGQRDGRVVAGLCGYFDPKDKCVRWIDSFATDDLSMGAILRHAAEASQEKFNAVYVEVDFLLSAPRALKTAEQLGFVPVAYLPGFFNWNDCGVDVVKMVKLNAPYSLENAALTPHARKIVDIINHDFQDQNSGAAVITLLRALPAFHGLGDGELGKIARLFTQKLYRAGETIFNKNDSSDEAYVVMRGKIDIILNEGSQPVASLANGEIIGEQAFLDGGARNASAIAGQPSILLVIQRPAFQTLVQTEPHLGMVVMRNIAIQLSNKLRRMDEILQGG